MFSTRFMSLAAAAAVAGAVALAAGPAAAAWPERPVTVIVPAAAGGGTDATGRLLAAGLQEIFGRPFNVVNQGQGGGAVGHLNIANARPDGYTIGVMFNYAQFKLMGQADLTRESFTPVAQFNFDPAGFNVKADSPYQTLEDALDDIKANPGRFNISCGGGCGGSWHLPMAGMFLNYGIDLDSVTMIPHPGAAVGLQELVAGGVDFVPCSLPEAGALIGAGEVRALVVMGAERLSAFPDVPTVQEELGEVFEGGAWRGVAGPAGMPQEIADKLAEALQQIYESEEFQTAMTSRGFGLRWRGTEEFIDFMGQHEDDTHRIMTALGLVQQ
jgi:tripartite-type tricarboxylate transporter receptor subunit TctC